MKKTSLKVKKCYAIYEGKERIGDNCYMKKSEAEFERKRIHQGKISKTIEKIRSKYV